MQVNIILRSLSTQDKLNSTTISYVNPEVSDAKLIELAQALNDFSTDSYVQTRKETKVNLD